VKWPCFYGIDFASRAELVANGLDIDGVRASINADSLGYVSEAGLIAATEQPKNRLCTACFTGQYPIPLGESEVLGKHVLEGIGRPPLPMAMPRVDDQRSVSGWTGQQAGSASVPGGAEDALTRP
jgi:amidophosphoribosyltransferase